MADVGISYSHNTAALAARVRREFIARRCTVWMDESDEEHDDAEDINLPWGQAHWQVITDEFADAGVVVVINDEHWQRSTYCQDELEFVNSWGKWVEIIDAPGSSIDPDVLSARVEAITHMIEQRRPLIGAHARLVRSARSDHDQPRSRVERLLRRTEERDARAVLAAADQSGVTVPEPLAAHGKMVLERADQTRRTARRIAVTGTAILAILAVVGVAALVFARASYKAAAASAARSQALDLASRSQIEPDTGRALSLAHHADSLAHSTTTTEAINIATANDTRLRTIVVGPADFYGAAWAGKAPIVVGYSINTMVVIDAESRSESKTFNIPDGIQIGTLAVSRDGTTAAYATRGRHTLQVLNLTTGRSTDANTTEVTAVATGDGDGLWWANDRGTIYRSTFSDVVADAKPTTYAAQIPVMAMNITAERSLIDYIDNAGTLHSGTYDSQTINEAEPLEITPADLVGKAERQLRATVKRCGDNVFGSVAGSTMVNGVRFARIGNSPVDKDRMGRFDRVTPAICNLDGTAWHGHLLHGGASGPNAPHLPKGSLRYLPVADPTDRRQAVLTNDGKLYIVADRRTQRYPADEVAALLPMATTEFAINKNGDVVDAASGSVTGNIGKPVPQTAELIGDDGMIVVDDGIAHIDGAGHTDLVSVKDVSRLQHLRAGSDGQHFVAAFARAVTLLSVDGRRALKFSIRDMPASEALVDADISPDGRTIAFTTRSGRTGIAGVDQSAGTVSTQRWSEHTMPSGRHNYVSYVPDTGNLIVVGADGDARLLDGNLATLKSSFVGSAVERLSTYGSWAIATSAQGVSVYDARNLIVVDRITRDQIVLSPSLVHLDAPRARLVGLQLLAYENSQVTTRFDIPLPTLRS